MWGPPQAFLNTSNLLARPDLQQDKQHTCASLMLLLGIDGAGKWFEDEFLPCVWLQAAGACGIEDITDDNWASVEMPLQEVLRQTFHMENELIRERGQITEKRQKLQHRLQRAAEVSQNRTNRMKQTASRIVAKKEEEQETRPVLLARRNQINRARKKINKKKVERPEEKGLPEVHVEVSCHVFFSHHDNARKQLMLLHVTVFSTLFSIVLVYKKYIHIYKCKYVYIYIHNVIFEASNKQVSWKRLCLAATSPKERRCPW